MMIDAPVPPEILKLRDERGAIVPTDCMPLSHFNSKKFLIFYPAINFSEFDREPSGKVNLIGRVKSVLFDSQSRFRFYSHTTFAGVILVRLRFIIQSFSKKYSQMGTLVRGARTENEIEDI